MSVLEGGRPTISMEHRLPPWRPWRSGGRRRKRDGAM